jgi:two-component system LytT family sensor kinase
MIAAQGFVAWISRRLALGWLVIALLRASYVGLVMQQWTVVAITRPLVMVLPWILLTPAIAWYTARGLATPRGHRWRWILGHFGCALLAALAASNWTYLAWTLQESEPPGPRAVWIAGQFDALLFNYVALVALVVAGHLYQRYRTDRKHQVRLETDLLRARLHVLLLQLQPHFLFNTLNAVAELVHRDGGSARRALQNLRALLNRSASAELPSQVPLSEELAALAAYVDIERMRFGSSLAVRIEADPRCESALIPPFLLQPLVENAIRHGVTRQGGGTITITLKRQGSQLAIEISDDGAGLGEYSGSGEGMGLGLTRRRLDELFGTNYSMALMGRETGGTVVRILLPLGPHQPNTESIAAPPPGHSLGRGVLLTLAVFAGWTLIGAFNAHVEVAREAPLAVLGPAGGDAYWRYIMGAWLWAGTTLVVFAVVRFTTWREYGGGKQLVLHAVMFLGSVALQLILQPYLDLRPLPPEGIPRLSVLLWNLYVYCFLAALVHAWIHRERARRQRDMVEQLELQVAEASFDELRWSIDPDFMIRALERVEQLAARSPGEADQAIDELSQILRRTLGAGKEGSGLLREEAGLLSARWKLQGVTTGRTPTVDIPPSLGELRFPSLLLNAMLVLIIPESPRELGLAIAARQDGDMLELEILLTSSNGHRPGKGRTANDSEALARWMSARFGPRASCEVTSAETSVTARASIPMSALAPPVASAS